MSGCWVIVCGASGAGKDSVLDWTAEALAAHPAICFARRLVTRAVQPESRHDEISVPGMEALRSSGGLAWHWQAHGLHYGVRAEYERRVADGDVVVVNGSREHARSLAGRANVRCVVLTASRALLQARLWQRAREDEADIARRMARNALLDGPAADLVITNDGELQRAGGALRDYLVELAR